MKCLKSLLVPQMMTGIECGHRFCTNCWTEYLTTKIIDEGMGQTISCAAHSCSILVDDHTVMRLIVDAKVKLKYQHLITKSFVEVSLYWRGESEKFLKKVYVNEIECFRRRRNSVVIWKDWIKEYMHERGADRGERIFTSKEGVCGY